MSKKKLGMIIGCGILALAVLIGVIVFAMTHKGDRSATGSTEQSSQEITTETDDGVETSTQKQPGLSIGEESIDYSELMEEDSSQNNAQGTNEMEGSGGAGGLNSDGAIRDTGSNENSGVDPGASGDQSQSSSGSETGSGTNSVEEGSGNSADSEQNSGENESGSQEEGSQGSQEGLGDSEDVMETDPDGEQWGPIF